jgi:hypothetical protein
MDDNERRAAVGDMRTSIAYVLPMLVVFDRPGDFPDHVVVRRCDVAMHEATHWEREALFESLTEARAWIARYYPRLTCVGRGPEDIPPLVETWL